MRLTARHQRPTSSWAKQSARELKTPRGFPTKPFYWSNASNFLVQNSPILTTSQDDSFVLPATNTSPIGVFTANNRGTWKITAAGIDDVAARAIAFITVTNPAEAAADLSVFKFPTSGEGRD